ncbi:GTP-binding protein BRASSINAZOLE INSENSITIVE PALE GREEN 2, chloroplastic [Impatiens glandulifera]|uniref:GTP-binding protein BRASSINAZOLE INSENSITIVE PALE GREEN 2, chloroplastic n=1 Tax=Impatiens glandulifera TaxID=253017 RepID=UPI001FB08CC6|nr:GTP-binding protein BRASSINAZOLE INSENSITIVE PALE GREEN 2, chloroplastic [Impatiens glandulifera]
MMMMMMMMIARTLSPSKLRRLLPFSHFAVPSHSPPFNPISDPIFINPTKTLLPILFRHFSSIPIPQKPSPLSLNRDGNFSESTSLSLVICRGCGVSMQDSDPKQPGFFIKPSLKSPDYKLQIDRKPIADESEISNSFKKGLLNGLVEDDDPEISETPTSHSMEKPVVCARCHSLRHYGKVKDPNLENLLPDFDFDHTVGRKLRFTTGTRTVVLLVVDAADFDGSFPRKVAKLVSDTIDENSTAWKEGKSGNVPRVVLVVTKIDLLPSSLSPTGLEHWVRSRAREGGANKLTTVHLVSAIKDWGVKNLIDDVVKLAGARGNVWAIGAQNAGKSTLINSIGKHAGGKVAHLTEAPVPGTTLGIIRVEGGLPGNTKLFDTPGLLNPHQITTRLTREEQQLVQMSKELKPRTYRIKAGHSVHIAGLMRVDVEESSAESIYVTVWASPYLPLHMGKMENACSMIEDHFGRQLQPPIGEKRVEEMGKWVRKEFRISGNSWDSSCVDVAASGLGWFAFGLRGEASIGVWTYDGVDVFLRNSLILNRARTFEVAGFTVSKIVSKADKQQVERENKMERENKKKNRKSDEQSEKKHSMDSA